ncbi:AAA family ATPase [Kitasatospora sp. NPDC053057]|uniref:AAA family ATPase n=1 Tax=Kitasatospora sp. NPDC053057 TaxID=3364062 RepID=UPI0037C87120
MFNLLVSQTEPRAYRTLSDALQAAPAGAVNIAITPGHYRTEAYRFWGTATITALGPRGSVVIDCSDEHNLQIEGRTTLQRLVLRNWHADGLALSVVGGTTVVEDCEFMSRSATSVSARGGAELFLRGSTVRDAGIAYLDAAGVIEGTEVIGAGACGIALRDGARVSVRNCRVNGAREHGIWITTRANPLIEQCEIDGPDQAGIMVDAHARAAIRGGSVSGSKLCGLVVRDDAHATVEGLQITAAAMDGVWCTTRGVLTADGVTVRDARRNGAVVDDGAAATLTNCVIEGSTELGLAAGGGGGSRTEVAGGRIERNKVGVGFGDDGALTMTGVELTRNADAGLVLMPGGPARLRHVTVTRTEGPGLIVFRGADADIEALVSTGNQKGDLRDFQPAPDSAPDSITAPATTPAPPSAPPRPSVPSAERPAGSTAPTAAPNASLDALLAELDAMIGLREVKEEIGKLVKFLRVAEQRRRAGVAQGPSIGRHMVFSGSAGTGKTTVARVYGRLLAALGVVADGHVTEVSRADLVGKVLGETAQKTTAVFHNARGGVLFIDEAYALSRRFGVGTDFGQEAIDTLVKLLEDHRDEVVVVFAGYSAEMREFLSANPGLQSRVSRTIEFEDYTPDELVAIVEGLTAQFDFVLADGTRDALKAHFQQARRTATFGNGREARRIFEAAIQQQALRLADHDDPSPEQLVQLLPEDLNGVVDRGLGARFGEARDTDQLDTILGELSAMVGLESIKQQIRDLMDLIVMARRRRAAGLPADPLPSHLVFSGPPGTGKTTVARLYGSLLAALGVLARGQVVEVSRAGLVGAFTGQTAALTAEAFERARGGVLFIDEAYALVRPAGSGPDYGQEAIDTLVKLMEDHRDEVVVIVAGYTDEMQSFLAANPGLASRFSATVEFPAYGLDELVEILVRMAEPAGYTLPADTLAAVRSHLTTHATDYALGNAREVRKLLAAVQTAQARRLRDRERTGLETTVDDLRLFHPEDIGA